MDKKNIEPVRVLLDNDKITVPIEDGAKKKKKK